MPKPSSLAIGEGLILTLDAEPLATLRPGPLRFLLALRKLAGHSRRFLTYTKSLAKLLGRCPNTIRAWRNELVEKGYIHWLTNARTGQTTILIRMAVEPPSRRNQVDPPKRKPGLWWKKPKDSSAWRGGTQFFASIKPKKEIGGVGRILPPIQAPVRSVEEQLRLLAEPLQARLG